jgi:hypothetical protein
MGDLGAIRKHYDRKIRSDVRQLASGIQSVHYRREIEKDQIRVEERDLLNCLAPVVRFPIDNPTGNTLKHEFDGIQHLRAVIDDQNALRHSLKLRSAFAKFHRANMVGEMQARSLAELVERIERLRFKCQKRDQPLPLRAAPLSAV